MKHRFGDLAFLQKSLGEIVVGRRVLRPEIHSRLKPSNGLIQFSIPQKNDAEIILGNVIVRSYRKRMRPECFAVSPEGCLNPRLPTQNTDYDRGSDG